MHPALRLAEILINIFGQCYYPDSDDYEIDLALLLSVATTCRAFKEPALDVLWEELPDLSPLACCVPEACYLLPRKHERSDRMYSFHRSLTEKEWEVLRSYVSRTRSIWDFTGFDDKAVTILANPPTLEPLFPNVRSFSYWNEIRPYPLFQLPFPSLTCIRIGFRDGEGTSLSFLPDLLQPFCASPGLRSIELMFGSLASRLQTNATSIDYICNWIRRWQDLEVVMCYQLPLNMKALQHLSRIPAMSQLEFTLDPTLHLDAPLRFANLRKLLVMTPYLKTLSHFLSQSQFPMLTDFTVNVRNAPPPQRELRSFLSCIENSVTAHKIVYLDLLQYVVDVHSGMDLVLDDLRPCTRFYNLRELHIALNRKVFLTTDDLLSLASAWPHMKVISINYQWGWKTLSTGITPNGFLQLLKMCPSLQRTAFVWDLRGYTDVPPAGLLERHGLALPEGFYIDVADSKIEQENIPAIAAFFTDILSKSGPLCSQCTGWRWTSINWGQPESVNVAEQRDRWDTVFGIQDSDV